MKTILLWLGSFCVLGAVAYAIIFLLRTQEPVIQEKPVLEIAIGDSKAVAAPEWSANPGSKWVEFTVTYQNKGKRPV